MADGISLSKEQVRDGPFNFPPPVQSEASKLYKSLYKLLNYLAVEWCGGELSTQLRIAFGTAHLGKCFDLGIIVSNSHVQIKKQKLDEVFSECQVLHPFLDMSVTSSSLMVTGTLSSRIQNSHKLWITPRGIIVQEQPLIAKDVSNTSLLCICADFRADIEMKKIKDLMYYFLVRLNIGCSDSLMIDLNLNHTPNYQFPYVRQYKPGMDNSARTNGQVNVKICRACQSCRVQTSKPKEITIQTHIFNVKICTRRCFGISNKCTDKGFRGKLTILGPGSIPVLHQSDEDFHNQFNSLVKNWSCMSDNQTHLILVFECSISTDNVHNIMSVLHETCFQVFSKHQSSFKSSVSQLLGKSSSSNGTTTVDLTTASRNLARAISEIVELSRNEDFKNTVKELVPYDSMESLQESILNKSRQFGLRERQPEESGTRIPPDSVLPPVKRRKTVTMGNVSSPPHDASNISVGGFCFTQTQDDSTKVVSEKSDDLDDFESLQ